MAHYSVPARLIGRRVRVSLRASEVVVLDGRVEVAHHPRLVRKGAQSLVLDHYLEVLARKPGALPGATALVQARAAGTFTAAHEAFWALTRHQHGDSGGTRALVEVLLLHRHLDPVDVTAGLTAAVGLGSANPDVVAVEARKAAHARGLRATVALSPAPPAPPVPVLTGRDLVASLTERRLRHARTLPTDSRPLPSVAAYDELLTHRAGSRSPTRGAS